MTHRTSKQNANSRWPQRNEKLAGANGVGRQFNFISGLPRSGSTLTAALLLQNPRFQAGMSSPVAGLFEGVISQVSAGTELSTVVIQDQRKRILKGLFDSYYASK